MSVKRFKVRMTSDYIVGPPGSTFSWYGHNFTVQPGGRSATAVVTEAFIRPDVAAGRYEIIEEIIEKETEKPKPAPPTSKPMSIHLANYYGCGDLERFRQRLVELREKGELVAYAKTIMGPDFPTDTHPKRLVDSICQMVESKISEGASE